MTEQEKDVMRANQRGRGFATRDLLTWKLEQIHQIVGSLVNADDKSDEDRAFAYGRIEELSK